MHLKFESFSQENEFIVLNNIVFNTSQIKDYIVKDFKPKNSNFNFCSKNKFLKTYFREINNQSIFNRIEWKFRLKKGVNCELITLNKIKPLDELQLRVILDFSSTLKAIDNNCYNLQYKENNHNEYLNLNILFDFSCKELEAEETATIDNIETISLKKLYEQNTAYFHFFSIEKICI